MFNLRLGPRPVGTTHPMGQQPVPCGHRPCRVCLHRPTQSGWAVRSTHARSKHSPTPPSRSYCNRWSANRPQQVGVASAWKVPAERPVPCPYLGPYPCPYPLESKSLGWWPVIFEPLTRMMLLLYVIGYNAAGRQGVWCEKVHASP